MKHRAYCFECNKFVDLYMEGDLDQFNGDVIDCPCGRESLAIKPMPLYGLIHVSDLTIPHSAMKEFNND